MTLIMFRVQQIDMEDKFLRVAEVLKNPVAIPVIGFPTLLSTAAINIKSPAHDPPGFPIYIRL